MTWIIYYFINIFSKTHISARLGSPRMGHKRFDGGRSVVACDGFGGHGCGVVTSTLQT